MKEAPHLPESTQIKSHSFPASQKLVSSLLHIRKPISVREALLFAQMFLWRLRVEEATERRQRSDTKCKDFEKVRKDKNKIYETGERNGNCCYIANAGATEKKTKKQKK